MSQSIVPQKVSQADIDLAIELLNKGEAAETVHGKLVERGMPQEVATGLLNDLFEQAVYNDAVILLNQGHSPDQVKRQLIEKGLGQSVAASVVDDILARNQAPQSEGTVTQMLLQVLGAVVFVVGIGLVIGNQTGMFPTFPFAGFIAMVIGGAIFGVAERASR